jgi:ABC-type amino acid transport substrate-binding protein
MNTNQSLLKPFLVSLITAIVVSLFAFVVIRNDSATTEPPPADRYSEIRERGTIRAGYYIGAPYFIVDPNKDMKTKEALSGIFFDVMEKVSSSLNLEIEWKEEVPFPDMAKSLNDGKVDIIGSGIWINAARASQADFTTPILYDAVCAFVRPNETRFPENLSNLNSANFTIAAIDGEMADTIAKSDFPLAKTNQLPQVTPFSDLMLNVRNGKADITFLGLASAQDYLSKQPGSLKNITIQKPLRIFPTAIMLPRNEYALKRAIDNALLELLNTGELEAIIAKYETVPGSHYRVAPSYIAPSE